MWRIHLQKKGLRHSSSHRRHFSHKLLQRNVLASHTNSERRKHPNLPELRPRDRVNLECDMVGKYVVRATQITLAEK